MVGFSVEDLGVLEVNVVVSDVAVFSNCADLGVKPVNIVLVLLDPLLKVLGFANAHGWTIRTWNPINDTLRSLFKGGDLLVGLRHDQKIALLNEKCKVSFIRFPKQRLQV